MNFKVGDRVVATDHMCLAKKGDTGTIAEIRLSGDLIVNWDRVVGILGSELDYLGIPHGHGEYVISRDNKRKLKKINESETYELHIICKDGITTNCVYKEDGKIVKRSSTRRNVREDDFDFKEAVKNCVERVGLSSEICEENTKTSVDGTLIGKSFKSGQKVRILNTDKHTKETYKNLELYVGQTGHFVHSGEFKENNYVSIINFDNPIMNKIDEKNGCLQWNYSEVILID